MDQVAQSEATRKRQEDVVSGRKTALPRQRKYSTVMYLLGALSVLAIAVGWSTAFGSQIRIKEPQARRFQPLIEADLEYLAAGLDQKLFTSVDLVKAYVARINQVNSTLHAVTELNPDAISIAQSLDELRETGTLLSPLHGIPLLIKNNIATDDQMNNTAGSWSLLGAKVPRDSTVAARLRKAGAVILGKTNLSQWANFRSNFSSSGWSAYGGQTFGAYYPEQDPSGSSSGSAVASSIALALASLGTETDGSILSPADVNNLVGIKPTVGLTSRYLVIPISEHQDTIGPLARSVKDAASVLQAIAGPDPRDNYTLANPYTQEQPDYVAACRNDSLAGARIGVAWNIIEVAELDPPVLTAFMEAIDEIQRAGATIVDANFTALQEYINSTSEGPVITADFLELTYNPRNIYNLVDELNFTHSFPLEDWPQRDTVHWEQALEQGYNNTSPQFWDVYQQDLFLGGEGGILGALKRTNTSAVILPTQISPGIPALVGSPVVSVPMGFYPWNTTIEMNNFGNLVTMAPNHPFGLSFMGAKWSEADLIGFAYAYEQRTLHRNQVQPCIVPNIELDDVVGRSWSSSFD